MKKDRPLKRALIMMLCAAVCCSAAAYAAVRMTHTLVIPYYGTGEVFTDDDPGIALYSVSGGKLTVIPVSDGQIGIMEGDELIAVVNCTSRGFAYDLMSERYTGAVWVHAAALVFLVLSAAVFYSGYRRQTETQPYDYDAPLLLALFLFSGLSLIIVLLSAGMPGRGTLERALSGMPFMLLLRTIPLTFIYTVFMFISNISLLRHEGRHWTNMLGSITGFLFIGAALFIMLHSDASGSLQEVRFRTFLINFMSGMVFWSLCKLSAVIVCGIRAAKHEPGPDMDYILILGCQIRDDGSLTPLLKGRVDRALGFARAQKEKTGRMPVLIPCGGRGDDEICSEAAAMKGYLLEQGFPGDKIITEDRSVNTLENIVNAKAMMEPGKKAAFSTTNYHVFRAGVWASRSGLRAEGMGSGTKWYFWPNAFMREYIALIAARWVHEAVLIVLFGLQSGILAYLMK